MRTDLLIVVVVCPRRHFEFVSPGVNAKRATVKERVSSRKPGACDVREMLSQNQCMVGKEGALFQKKVLDKKGRVATTVFIHSATSMSHTYNSWRGIFMIRHMF